MTRLLFLLTSLLMLAAFSPSASAQTTSTPTPALKDGKLPAGKSITDSKGRVIENGGANENGSVHFRYSGKLTRLANGNYTCSGEIPEVTNPSSQGSTGPINVNTNGEPTTINLNRNGTDPGGHVASNITGGDATVNVNGNFNDPSVGGTGNTVNMNGNNNAGSGAGAGSGGTVNMGGHGNSWNSGGGQWQTRN